MMTAEQHLARIKEVVSDCFRDTSISPGETKDVLEQAIEYIQEDIDSIKTTRRSPLDDDE